MDQAELGKCQSYISHLLIEGSRCPPACKRISASVALVAVSSLVSRGDNRLFLGLSFVYQIECLFIPPNCQWQLATAGYLKYTKRSNPSWSKDMLHMLRVLTVVGCATVHLCQTCLTVC